MMQKNCFGADPERLLVLENRAAFKKRQALCYKGKACSQWHSRGALGWVPRTAIRGSLARWLNEDWDARPNASAQQPSQDRQHCQGVGHGLIQQPPPRRGGRSPSIVNKGRIVQLVTLQ
ncbi:hypothetical protein BaRGS_00005788 [Batillaria attramentaria]|uniref:Uncharacterized protein n=1 Tax=Batillaria attramentaria TaxID=370345 RepID=A0ABD0LUK2_9CAEN